MTAAGLYVHIPFCSSRCSYCDFATGLYQSELAESYVCAVIQEIRSSQYAGQRVDTIYFGGGTPSLLAPSQLDRILSALFESFQIEETAEITLEINPGSATTEKLREFRRLGINRASFGAQTFDDAELAKLGRSHNAADTLRTFADLRNSGFANVSFDLIAGLPGQTLLGWQQNVKQALELQPEHLSFYLLEVHSGTPLAEHIRRGSPAGSGRRSRRSDVSPDARAGFGSWLRALRDLKSLVARASIRDTTSSTGRPYLIMALVVRHTPTMVELTAGPIIATF